MRNSVAFPVMGVLTVIAAAVGLQLGESAIAQIDPVYFSGPPPVVRDVTRDPRPQPAATYASAYGWAEGYQNRDLDCGGNCPASEAPTAYFPTSPPEVAVQPEPWRAPITFERVEYEQPADAREWREVSRYVHYPVTQEQAEVAESLAATQAAPMPAEEAVTSEPLGL